MLDGEGFVFRIRIVSKDAEEILVQRDDREMYSLNSTANGQDGECPRICWSMEI